MSNFKLDVEQVMGFDYETFISHQKALAISNPKEFYTERNEVLKCLKIKIVKDIYKDLFDALSTGTIAGVSKANFLTNGILPHYPPQLINDEVLFICKGVSNHLNEIVNILYPDDYQKIADAKATINTKGTAGLDKGADLVNSIANQI